MPPMPAGTLIAAAGFHALCAEPELVIPTPPLGVKFGIGITRSATGYVRGLS